MEKKIFDYWEADLQLYHDKLVQMISEINKSLVALDLLKENYGRNSNPKT